VNQKIPPEIFWHFTQIVGNFAIKFYTPIVRSNILHTYCTFQSTLDYIFYLITCNFYEVTPY